MRASHQARANVRRIVLHPRQPRGIPPAPKRRGAAVRNRLSVTEAVANRHRVTGCGADSRPQLLPGRYSSTRRGTAGYAYHSGGSQPTRGRRGGLRGGSLIGCGGLPGAGGSVTGGSVVRGSRMSGSLGLRPGGGALTGDPRRFGRCASCSAFSSYIGFSTFFALISVAVHSSPQRSRYKCEDRAPGGCLIRRTRGTIRKTAKPGPLLSTR